MKSSEVEVGGIYLTKVGVRNVEVRISRENPKGGWDAASVASGRPIRVADASRLRPIKEPEDATDVQPAPEGDESQVAPPAPAKKGKGKKEPAAAPKQPKAAREPKAAKEPKEPKAPGKMSALDAAAAVLKAAGSAMNCKQMIEAMAQQGLWSSNAPTPAATLSSAILREMTSKKEQSRFKKVDRGQFALNA